MHATFCCDSVIREIFLKGSGKYKFWLPHAWVERCHHFADAPSFQLTPQSKFLSGWKSTVPPPQQLHPIQDVYLPLPCVQSAVSKSNVKASESATSKRGANVFVYVDSFVLFWWPCNVFGKNKSNSPGKLWSPKQEFGDSDRTRSGRR